MTYRLEDEHAVIGAQQLCDQQLEELLLHAPRIDSILPYEVHSQGLQQIPGPLPRYLIQRILSFGRHTHACDSQ